MNTSSYNMEDHQRYVLEHLTDMFCSTFDKNVIESILIHRNWDVDLAVDDLMTMSSGNTFEIPTEGVETVKSDPGVSDPYHFQNALNSERVQNLTVQSGPTTCDMKLNNADEDIVILDEEEYVVPTESSDESDSNIDEADPLPLLPQTLSQNESVPTTSYATMAQKPASKKAILEANDHNMCAKPPFIIYQGYTSYDRIKRTRDSVERVKLYVRNRFKIMVLLRGCPGSGKSTLAKIILEECDLNNNRFFHIHSTDNFFSLNPGGKYKMNLDQLEEAHSWNQANVLSMVRQGLTPIIIDNINTRIWHMRSYVSMAVCAGYEIEVIEPDTPWAFNVPQLSAKGSHNVPKEQLHKMVQSYEHNVSATTLLKCFNLEYSAQQYPPQKGVVTITDPQLINVFERIYHTICVLPEKQTKVEVKLSKKQRKKERRRLRRLAEEQEREGFVELDKLTETDSNDSNVDINEDLSADEVELEEEADSDPSWCTVEDETVEESSDSDGEESEQSSSDSESSLEEDQNETVVKNEVTDFGVDEATEVKIESASSISDVQDFTSELKGDTVDTPLEASKFEKRYLADLPLANCIDQVLNNVLGVISDEVKNPTNEPFLSNLSDQNLPNLTVPTEKVSTSLVDGVHGSLSSAELLTKSIDSVVPELSSSKKLDDNSNLICALEGIAKTPSPVETSPLSTIEDANTLDSFYNADNRKLKLCNIEGQKNTTDGTGDTACSYKFKDDSFKNVIANDLWGKTNEKLVCERGEKELSDDNSDNSESRSNSSLSDEIAITDVHNTSNRFVNNDINSDQSERRKANINQQKNQPVENIWNVADSIMPELNTLKERILINSLDKVFNQSTNIDYCENTTAAPLEQREIKKQTNLPAARSTSTAFQMIENKIKEECRSDSLSKASSPCSSRSEDFEDAVDASESKFWNQWVCGESWDDAIKDQEFKKNDSEVRPPRKVRDSSSKQKNTEATGSIRLVNDIRNASDNSKMCLLMDKKNNQVSSPQPLKATNFQSQLWKPHSLNTMQRMPSKEDDIESDFEAKSKTFRFEDLFERNNHQLNRTYPSLFRNFDANESQFWPGLSDSASNVWSSITDACRSDSTLEGEARMNTSPELLDSLIARHRNVSRDENSSDFEKSVFKWSGSSDVTKSERNMAETKSNNFFIPVEILNLERNKATSTGVDDNGSPQVVKIGRCREINEGRSTPERSPIELSYKCDKSTMTDGSSYTVKAKPLKEDLLNIFPTERVDGILDLYEKCGGNMDWMIEILMEDGYSPSDDQLEYLSSLQNVVEYETDGTKVQKDKKITDKKKSKKNGKNGRGGNGQEDPSRRKKAEAVGSNEFNESNFGDGADTMAEEYVDLFLDWSTVSQLIEYFGNPTIYSIKDYQPTMKLPVSLARQLHAYLIGSIIDQAEENEDLIEQLTEENYSISNYMQNSNVKELSQKDVIEVENSLNDILKDPFELFGKVENAEVTSEMETTASKRDRNENSFASKLSYNLLLRAFPTIDSSFVRKTFKSQNFNYYDTKNVLNQYGKEVTVDAPQASLPHESETEDDIQVLLEAEDDIQLFSGPSHSADTRSEVLQQVTEYRRNASVNQRQWQKCHENLRIAVQEKKFGVAAYYRDIMNVCKQKYEQNNAHAAAVLINSCCLQNSDMIDLHYFKVAEAIQALDKFLDEHIMKLMSSSGRSRIVVYIITGRGARSLNGISRIQPSVKSRLKRRNINFEVESYNTGLVKAILRKNSLMSTDL